MTHAEQLNIAQDFEELRAVLASFYHHLSQEAWDAPTGEREKDWTLHELTAHLVSIAQLLNAATEAALAGDELVIENYEKREDLRAWNAAQIDERTQQAPVELKAELFDELRAGRDLAAALTAEQLAERLDFVVYNRPAPVLNLVEWHLSHIGVVHAAQLTRPTEQPPLWTHYSDEFTHRQIDRFMRHFSWAYWNTLAPEVNAKLNFHIGGESGGDWLLVAAPDGGNVSQGTTKKPDYDLTFADASVLFGVFTIEVPMEEVLNSGDLKMTGDPQKVHGLLRLFSASPPNMQ